MSYACLHARTHARIVTVLRNCFHFVIVFFRSGLFLLQTVIIVSLYVYCYEFDNGMKPKKIMIIKHKKTLRHRVNAAVKYVYMFREKFDHDC